MMPDRKGRMGDMHRSDERIKAVQFHFSVLHLTHGITLSTGNKPKFTNDGST